MRVRIDEPAMADPKGFRHITQIVWLCIDGMHKWDIPSLEAVEGSAWLASESAAFRRMVKEFAAQSARSGERKADLVVCASQQNEPHATPPWRLPAREAEHYLRQPIYVVVENARCDGTFLQQVVLKVGENTLRRALGEVGLAGLRRSWLNSLGDGRWISIRHGGGGSTADQIKLLVESSPMIPPRIVVVVDSDKENSADDLGGTASKVIEICAEVSQHHYTSAWTLRPIVLKKREVENYLPHSAIRARYGQDRLEAALQTGDPDYANLKSIAGDLWKIMAGTAYQQHLHAQAWRARAGDGGRELEMIIERLLEAR